MTTSEIEKIVNRFAEADNQKFTKIPTGLITAQKVVNLVREELEHEKKKQDPSEFNIQVINGRLIAALRVLAIENEKAAKLVKK